MADLDDVFLAAAADPSVAALIEDARPVFLFDRRGSRLLFVNAAAAEHLGIGDLAALRSFQLQPGHPTARRVAAIDGQLGPGQARTDRVPLSRSVVPQSVVCRASRFRFAGERGILLVVLDAAPRFEDAAAARAAFERLFAATPEPAADADEPAAPAADAALAIAVAPALVADDEPPAVVTTPLASDEPPPASLHDAMDLPDLGTEYGQEDPTAGAADPDAEAAGTGPAVSEDEGTRQDEGTGPDGGSRQDEATDDVAADDVAADAPAADRTTERAEADESGSADRGEPVVPLGDDAVTVEAARSADDAEGGEDTEGGERKAAPSDGEAGAEPPQAEGTTGVVDRAPAGPGDTTPASAEGSGEPEPAVDEADTSAPPIDGAGDEEPETDDRRLAEEVAASSEATGFRFPDHGRSVRFVFELDAGLAFAFVSDDLTGVVGPSAAPRLGDTWADLATRMDLDPRGRVQNALARHDTFTGLTVDWPVEGGTLRLPVDLAGMPVFARDRTFRGYRGFGIAKTGAVFSIAPAAPAPVVDTGPVDAASDEAAAETAAVDVAEDAPAGQAAAGDPVLEPVDAGEDLPARDERAPELALDGGAFAADPDVEATEDAVAAMSATSTEAADETSQPVEEDDAALRGPTADPIEADETGAVEADETGAVEAVVDVALTDVADDAAIDAAGVRPADVRDVPPAGAAPVPSVDTSDVPSAETDALPAAAPFAPTLRSPARGDGLAAALLAAAAAAAVAGHRTSPREPTTVATDTLDDQAPPSEPTDDATVDETAAVVADAESEPTLPVALPLAEEPPLADEREGVVIGLDPDRIYAAESLLFGGMTEPPPPDDAVPVVATDAAASAGDDEAADRENGLPAEGWSGADTVDTAATASDTFDRDGETDGDPQPDVDDGFEALHQDTTVGAEPDDQPETLAPLAEPADAAAESHDQGDVAFEQGDVAFDQAPTADESDAERHDAPDFDGEEPLDLVEEPDPASNDVTWSERGADVIPSPVVARSVPPEPPLSAADAARRQLSRPEREAFQKIAEALGARLHDSHHGERPNDPDARPSGPAEADSRAFSTDGPGAEPPDDTDGEAGGTVVRGAFAAAAPMLDLAVLDRLPVAVALLRQGEAIAANRAFLDLAGYPDLGALDAAGGFAEAFVGSPLIRDHRLPAIRRRDGVEVPVHVRLHSVPFQGAMASMLVVQETAKATGPIRAETAEARVGELEAILDTATDGVLLIDTSGRILGANRSAEALFGAGREAMVGAPLIDYLAPESHRNALDYLDGLSRNGVASVLNDGREVIGRVRRGGLVPLFMTVGRVSAGRFCAVLRDITQWKRAEEELTTAKRSAENASSQKSDFLAKISHEIRTPLNAIIGFSEVMMEERFGPVGSERYKEYLRDIHMSGSLIMSLVNDLLDLSKIEAGKLDLAFEAVPVNEVVRECVALMQPQANRERIIIRTSLSSSLPNVVADHRSLRQIVLNLLSNAIKFNQPGGQVIVSTLYEDSGEVALRVRDTGPGMSPDDVEKALEPFRQLHTTRPGRGTGLGLPLTKALVEANRAAFRIDSAPGQGTLVQVTFPSTRVLAE